MNDVSHVSNQANAILLPAAGVRVFSTDSETLAAARGCTQDWRFARVNIGADEGDVETAIKVFGSETSPELVIIQTDTIDESLTGQLERLAGCCHEGTAAIVIGPVNDVYLYRKLVDMGVSDYLVKPVDTVMLGDVIAKTLIERVGVSDSRLIALVGAKGGVGTTALCEGLAWGVSEFFQQKTLVIDAAGGWSSMNVGMGYEPSTTLAEAVKAAEDNDQDSLTRMLFEAGELLSVLASGGDSMLDTPISASQMEALLDVFLTKTPVVICDISHATPEISKSIITRANHILIISTPTLSSLRLAKSLAQEATDLRGGEGQGIDMIINMQGKDKANEISKGDMEQALDVGIASFIPFRSSLFLKCENEGKRIIDDKEGANIVQDKLLNLVQRTLKNDGISEGMIEQTSKKNGLFKWFAK